MMQPEYRIKRRNPLKSHMPVAANLTVNLAVVKGN